MSSYYESPTTRATPPVAALTDRACAGVDPMVFFPDNNTGYKIAREICGRCPHQQPCRDWAVQTRQGFGVWGGTSPDERAELWRAA